MSRHVDELFVEINQLPLNTQVTLAKDIKLIALKERIAGLSTLDKAKLTDRLKFDHKERHSKPGKAQGCAKEEPSPERNSGRKPSQPVVHKAIVSDVVSSEGTPEKNVIARKKAGMQKKQSKDGKQPDSEKKINKRARVEDVESPQEHERILKRQPDSPTCSVCGTKGHTMRSCMAVKDLRKQLQEQQESHCSSSSCSSSESQ